MQMQEVQIRGEAFTLISREDAERIIREASPRAIAAKALEQAYEWNDGSAVLSLSTGEIMSAHIARDARNRPDHVFLHLFETSGEDVIDFGRELAEIRMPSEEAEEMILSVDTRSRWVDAYLTEHGEDPDPEEILSALENDLDEVYGEKE
jgi:hypothetical protein